MKKSGRQQEEEESCNREGKSCVKTTEVDRRRSAHSTTASRGFEFYGTPTIYSGQFEAEQSWGNKKATLLFGVAELSALARGIDQLEASDSDNNFRYASACCG